jgi:hypothetical protein
LSAITDAMWYFWTEFKKIEPTVQLGGIYANKPGYHNTRAANSSTNYSVILPPDKLGPSDKAAAIDLTFPDAQAGNYSTIARYSSRLLKSGQDPNDNRGNYLREFYGNADFDNSVEGWDFYYARSATSDTSHLWHIHISFLRKYVTSLTAMDSVLSILRGDPVLEEEDMTPSQEYKLHVINYRIDGILSGRTIVSVPEFTASDGTKFPALVNTNGTVANLADLKAELAEIKATLATLNASGVPVVVDYAALAKAVNDDAAARMAS